MLTSLAPARRRLVLGVCALLVVGLAGVLAVVLTGRAGGQGSGQRSGPPVSQDVAGPVLLVPGYGGSIGGLNVLAGRLRALGKDAAVVSLPDNAEGDLSAQAAVVAAAATATLVRTGAASLDVVGYSAGGVVLRLWLKQVGRAARVRRVVTLGSPQHGTALAALGGLFAGQCPTACQQLSPTSDVLSRLNSADGGSEVPASPRFISLWTSHDEVVLPPRSAELTGAINVQIQSVCSSSAVTHSQLPSDPLVAAMVTAELRPSPAVALSSKDCARLLP